MRIDAHHHLWSYTPEEYGWIDDSMQTIRQDFLLPDLEHNMALAAVDATITVQARQTIQETNWLLTLAEQSEAIRGVVGWAPIASPDFPSHLERLTNQNLKGLRHVVQAEQAGFLDDPAFNAGIAALTPTGLVYDILIKAPQLAEATRFVDRHPNQSFVLDHIAKPNIAGSEIIEWSLKLREIALRPNVTCKLSGMVTEADWQRWTREQLTPYFHKVLEAFGPSRLMAGSDWPVLNVACDYRNWWQLIESWIAPLSTTERAEIEGDVATRVYKLDITARN